MTDFGAHMDAVFDGILNSLDRLAADIKAQRAASEAAWQQATKDWPRDTQA